MNRRQVLKNIGLGAGYVMVAPAAFNLLQSCKSEPKNEWQPVFLNVTNGMALTHILDVILPKTDTPGASDLNIAQFIDAYMDEVAEDGCNEAWDKKSAHVNVVEDVVFLLNKTSLALRARLARSARCSLISFF